METRSDLVLELFREPLEIDQICQLQRLSPQWNEQSINRVFHSTFQNLELLLLMQQKDVEEWKHARTLYLNYLENH